MPRRTSLIAAAATCMLLPALLTACSGRGSGDPPTPSPAHDDSSTKIAECVREQGFDMPDQKAGTLSLSPPDGVDQDEWMAAVAGCAEKNPPPGAGTGEAPKPDAATRKQFAEYGECMREHGIADFPDDMSAQGSYDPSSDPAYSDADSACSKKLPSQGAALPR